MGHFLTEYSLFLAKTLTLLAAIIAVIVISAVSRRRHRTGLRVRNIGDRYDQAALSIRSHLLPKKVVKATAKEIRRRRKVATEAAGTASEEERRPRLFVLDFRGDLRASHTANLREEITALITIATNRDEVLVRLENPGGTVHEQGFAASQLLRIRQRGIPLTVAVDKVAASGGYLMACVANRIVAAPFAVIGSIGVLSQVPNFHRLLDRYGVDVEQFTGGQFKRTVTMFGENTDADRAKLQEQIEDTHALFKDFVASFRPQVDIATVATGEHWYGARALELHLVDELITSDDYLLIARDRADIFEVSYIRPPGAERRWKTLLGTTSAILNGQLPTLRQ